MHYSTAIYGRFRALLEDASEVMFAFAYNERAGVYGRLRARERARCIRKVSALSCSSRYGTHYTH